MSDDFGDVSGFEKPTVPDEVVNTLISLVINQGANSEDQVEEDLDILVDVLGLEYLKTLADMLSRDKETLVESLLHSDTLREALISKLNMYQGMLSRIDFDDDGEL